MQNQTLLARRMRETLSVKNNQSQNSLNFFQGNIAVIAVSSAVKSFGAGLISTYVSLYFVELGGSPITLGLMTAMTYVIGCAMFPLGGFLFQTVDPTLPFYLFTAAEIIAAFFLISLVREPEKKET